MLSRCSCVVWTFAHLKFNNSPCWGSSISHFKLRINVDVKFQGNTLPFSNDVSVWDYSAFACNTMVTTDWVLGVLWNQSGIKKWHIYEMTWSELDVFSCSHRERIRRCAAVLRWQYYRHITAVSLWLDQVSAAQDVVRQFILRLIHFLLNCSPNLRCNLSCPCESYCFASLEKMRLCFHVVFFLTVPNISWKQILFVRSDKIFLWKKDCINNKHWCTAYIVTRKVISRRTNLPLTNYFQGYACWVLFKWVSVSVNEKAKLINVPPYGQELSGRVCVVLIWAEGIWARGKSNDVSCLWAALLLLNIALGCCFNSRRF